MGLNVTIRNYKSIKNAQIDLRSGLNILIGPNGSGKTCLLSSLKFLRDVFRLGVAQAVARQGGARRVYNHGQNEMYFSFTFPYGKRIYQRKKVSCHFFWEIMISQAGPENIATIVYEKIEINTKFFDSNINLFSLSVDRTESKPKTKSYLCPVNDFGRDLFSIWNFQLQGKNKTQISDNFKSVIIKDLLKRINQETDRSFFPIIASLDNVIAKILSSFQYLNEYNILPEVARESTEQLPFSQMSPHGAAVSEVIYALENEHYHKLQQSPFFDMDEIFDSAFSFGYDRFFHRYGGFNPYFKRYGLNRRNDFYKNALENINKELSAAVKPISKVSVSIDPTNGRRFVVFKAGKDEFNPAEVSDGTVKWLCILVSLFVPFSIVYLLEEPENFLHPWMQQRLISIMRDQAKKNDTIFLLSSHSSTILNGAYPEEILIVKHSDNGTIISEMSDVDSIRDVLKESDFHLGDLWVSGAIGGVPADE